MGIASNNYTEFGSQDFLFKEYDAPLAPKTIPGL